MLQWKKFYIRLAMAIFQVELKKWESSAMDYCIYKKLNIHSFWKRLLIMSIYGMKLN
jgi:hypothetical protein